MEERADGCHCHSWALRQREERLVLNVTSASAAFTCSECRDLLDEAFRRAEVADVEGVQMQWTNALDRAMWETLAVTVAALKLPGTQD